MTRDYTQRNHNLVKECYFFEEIRIEYCNKLTNEDADRIKRTTDY